MTITSHRSRPENRRERNSKHGVIVTENAIHEEVQFLNGLNYKEPMNSNFSDCTNEKLKELYAEDVEDDNEEEDVD